MARVNTESVIAQDTWTHVLFSTSGDRVQLIYLRLASFPSARIPWPLALDRSR